MATKFPLGFRWMTDAEVEQVRIRCSIARTSGRSRRARVRLDQLRAPQLSFRQQVESMAAAMERGEQFSPITIVPHEEDGLFWIADGCHRSVAALRLGRDEIDAVILGEGVRLTPS